MKSTSPRFYVAAIGTPQHLPPLENFILQVERRRDFRKTSGSSSNADAFNDRYDDLLLSVLMSLKKAVPYHGVPIRGENQELLEAIQNLRTFLKDQNKKPDMSKIHLCRAARVESPHLQAYLSTILPDRPVVEIPEFELDPH